ncbi:helix-turn-helix transcriptional regulator [Georgenia sp. MJ173]|uniref:helix-turn-helix domain-containing protein n=1 Tax=Georgenia sunbinii TaxID=3117728 RepID=UPI002F26C997
MRERTNALGTYLRARRELVTPHQAGIPTMGARRVPGLRREEVAMLAGISVDYYLRLERGRDRNPSLQVLEAIARVLQLDDEHRAHLRSLVAQIPRGPRQWARDEPPPAGALTLLHSLPQPAFIENRFFDIVASNGLARAVSPRLTDGGNQLRDVFLDPAERALHPDWEGVTECLVASLRHTVGNAIDDPHLGEFVGELLRWSPRFRQLWARHDVRGQRGATLRLDHPQVGEMTLHRERLAISGTEGMELVVLHAAPGSVAADRLALLGAAVLVPSAA